MGEKKRIKKTRAGTLKKRSDNTMFNYGLGAIPSPNYDKIIDVNEVIPSLKNFIDLPKAIDHTPNMLPVRSQGQESSCVGFGVSACKEYFDKKEYSKDIILSPRYIYEKARKIDGIPDVEKGTTIPAALEVLKEQGACEESFWPYIENNKGTPNDGYVENAKKYRIKSYARITSTMDVFKVLATHGPCLMLVPVYKSWNEEPAESTGKLPIPPRNLELVKKEKFPASDSENSTGWHCICIVGYNDDTQTLKFKNSWGPWGENGYGYLPYEYFRLDRIELYTMIDIVG
ncbi:TPA: C1 family peptidase [Bacillus cereus]